MRIHLTALLALAAVVGCQDGGPGAETVDAAMARLSRCVDQQSARCLYDELDRDSRWSVQTLHRTLAEARELVERSYPEPRRRAAFGSWYEEAMADDPAGLFAAFCAKRRCLEQLAGEVGPVTARQILGPGEARVTTTRDAQLVLSAPDGRFGLARFRSELQTAKIAQADRLKQVRADAAAFDEQRIALGSEGSPDGGNR